MPLGLFYFRYQRKINALKFLPLQVTWLVTIPAGPCWNWDKMGLWRSRRKLSSWWLIDTATLGQMHTGIAAAFRGSRCSDGASCFEPGWFCLSMPLSARGKCSCYCESWQLLWPEWCHRLTLISAGFPVKYGDNEFFLWSSGILRDDANLYVVGLERWEHAWVFTLLLPCTYF